MKNSFNFGEHTIKESIKTDFWIACMLDWWMGVVYREIRRQSKKKIKK